MLLAGSYMQSQATGQNKDKMQSVLDAFGSFGKYMADQSYVKNIGELVAAMQGDTTKGNPIDTLITNDTQQLLPFRAFSGWLAKLLDPTQRQIDSSAGAIQKQVQSFMMQIPGLRQQLQPKMDAQGNPIPNQNRFFNAVSPVQASQTTPTQEQQFQNAQQIKNTSSAAIAQSKAVTSQAQQEIAHIQSLGSPEEKKAYLMNLAQTDPALTKKVIDTLKTSAKTANLSPDELKLQGSSTIVKAQIIKQALSTMSDVTAKKTYLQDLATKGILTSAVLKEIATPTQQSQIQPAQTLTSRISAYFSAATSNPVQTFHDIFSGQTIKGTSNGAVLVDRMSLAQSEAIKQSLLPPGGKSSDYQLDHIIPLEIGGTNERSNLQLLTKAQDQANNDIENYLGKALSAKKVSAQKAVQLMLDYKKGNLTADDVHKQVEG